MATRNHTGKKDFDVIIVGLGPTGATLSGLLAQRGVQVAVFDKLPDLYPLPRAIGLDHEVMRVMQELHIADRIQPHTAPYRPSEYRGVAGQLIKRLDMAPEPHPLGWAPNHVFDQPAFEREIRNRLTELSCVQTFVNAEVLDWEESSGNVNIKVLHQGGDTASYSSRLLIACDGGSSPIRKSLGIGLEDLDFHEHWLVVDAIVKDSKLAELPQTQVQYCEPERPSTFVIGPGNHRRWEIVLLPGDSLSEDFPDAELWPLLERWIQPGDAEIWRAAAYHFHGLVARRWRTGRFIIAGDSAHMTPPFMAQGMVQGIRDAQNLAWKIARIVNGESELELLDTYQEERRPHVVATTRVAIELGKIICERDPARAELRDSSLIRGQGGEIKTVVRQNSIPGLQAGIIDSSTPGAGEIFPQPTVRTALSSGPLDDVTGANTLVVATEPFSPEDAAKLATLLAPLNGLLLYLGAGEISSDNVITASEIQPLVASWLGDLGQTFAVVRPDHYVYGTARSVGEVITLLRQFSNDLCAVESLSECVPDPG